MLDALADALGNLVPPAAAGAFRADFRGQILMPGTSAYEEARRVFNGMIDRRPALVVRPADTNDVRLAVRLAREAGVRVSVKGGGHSAPGYAVCDGGLMIDLSLLKTIEVNPIARTSTAQGGVTWGELDRATQKHGLAVTGGRIPSTGIGGQTLGSGSGWLERKLGFTVDSLLGAEVVLANGDAVCASDREHPELFWGLRGGGGNFGIVTRFEYRLHPIGPTVYGGLLLYALDAAPTLLRAYRNFMEGAPDDVCGGLAFFTAPSWLLLPARVRGRPAVLVIVCYTGNPRDGRLAIKPLLDLRPVGRRIGRMRYVKVQALLEKSNPPGMRNYWKAHTYAELPDQAIDAMVDSFATPRSPSTVMLLQPMGGQVARVPEVSTATGFRGAKWSLHVLGSWRDAAEDVEQIQWVRTVADVMKPWAEPGTYLNYLMDEGEERVRESFGGQYARLVALKTRYDPTNFFNLNQNIPPASIPPGGPRR